MLFAVSCLLLVAGVHYSVADDDSMAECQVRCPAGMVCVRLENSHFHLCTRRTSLNSTLSSSSNGELDWLRPREQAAGSSPDCPEPSGAPGPCVVQCRYHSDCQADQACCSNGCGFTCVSTVPNQLTKPGSCPTVARLVGRERCGPPCNTDADCQGRHKCCRSTRCGSACVAPCFHWLTSTGLNPWRLSHRCRDRQPLPRPWN